MEAKLKGYLLLILLITLCVFAAYPISVPFLLLENKVDGISGHVWFFSSFVIVFYCATVLVLLRNWLETQAPKKTLRRRGLFLKSTFFSVLGSAVLGLIIFIVVKNSFEDKIIALTAEPIREPVYNATDYNTGTYHFHSTGSQSGNSSSSSSSSSHNSSSSSSGSFTGYYKDPYDVHDYDGPDDFADDWGDYFDSYEEAEDFWDDYY